MFIGTLPPTSNRARWVLTREVVDEDTDEVVDLTGRTLRLEIRQQATGSPILTATTENDAIEIRDTGVFEVTFTRDQMATLPVGTYEVGLTISNDDDETDQLFIGTLPVLDGVVTR